jgi:hypothetical protein
VGVKVSQAGNQQEASGKLYQEFSIHWTNRTSEISASTWESKRRDIQNDLNWKV